MERRGIHRADHQARRTGSASLNRKLRRWPESWRVVWSLSFRAREEGLSALYRRRVLHCLRKEFAKVGLVHLIRHDEAPTIFR